METARTTLRTATAALRVPRFLAALALAAALVAIPVARPEDAGALQMSERTARWLCSFAGGSIDFGWGEPSHPIGICTLPSGEVYFSCDGAGYDNVWRNC